MPSTVIALTVGEFIYGPFLDEEFFFYDSTWTVIKLDAVQIFDKDHGFVGFDDLERIHDQGRDGSYDRVVFSGVAPLKKVVWFGQKVLSASGAETLVAIWLPWLG